jgi:hypothetical protein
MSLEYGKLKYLIRDIKLLQQKNFKLFFQNSKKKFMFINSVVTILEKLSKIRKFMKVIGKAIIKEAEEAEKKFRKNDY